MKFRQPLKNSPILPVPLVPAATFYITATNRRNPDFNSALIGQLKKITYPTKASTEFTYEANTYYAKQTDDFNPCSGNYQSVASVSNTVALNCASVTNSFTVAAGEYVCVKAVYDITIFSQGQDIIEGTVSLVNTDNGITAFTKTLTGINAQNPSPKRGEEFVVLPAGTYNLVAYLCGENASGNNQSRATLNIQAIPATPPGPPVYVTKTSGGLRIKEVKDCPTSNDAPGCLVKEYSYATEDNPTNSSGRIVSKGRYYFPAQYFSNDDGFLNVLYLNSASQLPLSTTLGHYIGYKSVTIKEAALDASNQKIYKGKAVSNYQSPDEFADLSNTSNFPYWSVSQDFQRGTVNKTKVYDEAGDWLSEQQNVPFTKSSSLYNKLTGLKSGRFAYNVESATPGGYDPNFYYVNPYPSITGFVYNAQTVQKQQFKVNGVLSSIESMEDYEYDDDVHLQMTQSTTTSSKNEALTTQYKYPNDITSGDLLALATALTAQFRKGELLQTETFRGATSVGKTQNFFDVFGTNLLPSKQRTFIGGSSVAATESFQLSYGLYGNLTSFKEEAKGTVHSFLWGYSSEYPVVYVANGVPADLSALETTTDATTIENYANSLRTTLPNAHISNFTYQPMIGLSTQTAPHGVKNSFAYDGLNRLAKITDKNGDILKAYNYHVATSIGDNNLITEFLPRTASATLPTSYQEVKSILSYVDGLGRPLQTVEKNAGGDGTNDIISNAKTYDGFGRPTKSYINFPNTGNGALASLPATFDGDTHPYSENILFDNSPLNRLFQVQGVGQAWANANKKSESFTEISGEIRSYSVAADGSVSSGTYPANSLFKTTVINEQGNKMVEYKDKEGRIVQKEQELNATETAKSAYIFNDLSQLVYVVQPSVYDAATSFNQSSNIYLEGIFGYNYSNKGLLTTKHVPGAGVVRMCYDQLNRVVLENDDKDANEATNFYKFTRYDAFSRVIQTGLTFNIGAVSQTDIQTNFDNLTQTQLYETKSSSGLLGYTNTSFPTDYRPEEGNFRTVTYFDDYDSQTNSLFNFQSGNAFHLQQVDVKGLMTGMLIRNLETNDWYKSVNYFDFNSRVIQSFNQNHLGGIDRSDYQYRFNGEVLKMRMLHKKAGAADITEVYEYGYDHVGRKTSFVHNGKPIAKYLYDATGRLETKKFSPAGSAVGSKQTGNWTDVNTWLSGFLPSANDNVTINAGQTVTIPSGQTGSAGILNNKGVLQNFGTLNMGKTTSLDLYAETFKYHIRGSLRGINLDANNDLTNTLFSFKLTYEDDGTYFDGNIRNQYWKSNLDGIQRAYQYGYDFGSRITQGAYGSTKTNENYALENMAYDLNGNITNLWRKGMTQNNTFDYIDKLGYSYGTNSNKINSVSDAVSGNLDTGDFRDGNSLGNDYDYWEDGSLKKDLNKGISSINYNYLKLPKKITYLNGNTLENQYNANGKKLKSISSDGITYDFVGNTIYKNDVLYQIGIDEGRIVNGQYEYDIKDHLGNLRVSFRDSLGIAKISTKLDYDPWGLTLKGLTYTNPALNKNNFQYNSKEFIAQTGLNDFGWRQQDPVLGRMWGSDRFAEKYYGLSNYQFAGNNPIMNIDVNGDSLMLFKNGTYVSTIDNGKKEITGFDQQSTIGKDGKESFTGGQSFGFNDYADDMEGIKSGELKLRFVNNNEIRSTLIETGVTDETSRNSPWSYIERESRPIGDKSLLSCTSTGCMDYQNITNKKFNSLNVVKGVAYNNADYGNFLWGQAGKQLGFSLNSLTTAAHLNNAVNSRKNNPDQPYGFFDSDGDQRAIKQGYKYNVGKINVLKR